jgi:hypothetical protein
MLRGPLALPSGKNNTTLKHRVKFRLNRKKRRNGLKKLMKWTQSRRLLLGEVAIEVAS